MYKATDRERLLNRIISFMRDSSAFEGLIQIGSGAVGFADIYSDIDLMAGCYDADCVKDANQQLQQFFVELGACHIEKRAWTSTVLGLSVYFEDGLSADISFMPTPELPIRSPQHKIVFAKTENFTEAVNAGAQRFAERSQRYGLDDSIHYRFINELRYVEIALLREQFIFADIALGNARQLLLSVETVTEGKKLHQFKAYNSLSQTFLDRLEETYPGRRTHEDMHTAKEKLLALYLETVRGSDYLTFDDGLLKLLGCFE
ncbi:MAG: hypothetical protein IJX47_09460 [Clostridia bacterium]|nr:hypothetical protein [Clostridia bacterium]